MTDIQKAIKHFECVRDGAIAVLDSGFGTKPNESNTVYKNRKLYAELAISALEKQIPKKPIKSDREIRYCEVWKCHNCGFEWSGRVVDYCYKCGQAIDWSDEG